MKGTSTRYIRASLLLFCLFAFGTAAFAQDYPRAEVFGGYSFANIDTNGLTSRQNLNGWEADVSGNFNKWYAAEFDVSGVGQELESNKATELHILSLVDDTHPATAELLDDSVVRDGLTDHGWGAGTQGAILRM